jgi:hypothetical protein
VFFFEIVEQHKFNISFTCLMSRIKHSLLKFG